MRTGDRVKHAKHHEYGCGTILRSFASDPGWLVVKWDDGRQGAHPIMMLQRVADHD